MMHLTSFTSLFSAVSAHRQRRRSGSCCRLYRRDAWKCAASRNHDAGLCGCAFRESGHGCNCIQGIPIFVTNILFYHMPTFVTYMPLNRIRRFNTNTCILFYVTFVTDLLLFCYLLPGCCSVSDCLVGGEGGSYSSGGGVGIRTDRSSHTRTCQGCGCGQRLTQTITLLPAGRLFRRSPDQSECSPTVWRLKKHSNSNLEIDKTYLSFWL